MSREKEVIDALEQRPMTFTDLKEETGLENGVIQFHVNSSDRIIREKGALMLKDECGRCKLRLLCRDSCLRTVLEDENKSLILKNYGDQKQSKIAEMLSLSEATVSYHVSRLKELGLIQQGKVVDEAKFLLED